jgi:DNA-directed RNA polymerase subunit alpha
MDLNVERGKGYQPGTHVDGMPIGTLPVDAIFTPVVKVNYTLEHTRVEQFTNYDKLVLEVWTDGSITPLDAVRQAAQVLVDQFFLFCTIGKTLDAGEQKQPLAYSVPAEQYNTPIEKLNLSPRTHNCLKRSNINKVGEVLERSKEELLNIRNFGEKSLQELYEKLSSMGFISEEIKNAITADKDGSAESKSKPKAISDLQELKKVIPMERDKEDEEQPSRRG